MWKKWMFVWMVGLLSGCSGDDGAGNTNDGFDRKAMLENWADHIILPGYEAYISSLDVLDSKTTTFITTPTIENLDELRTAWLNAYLDWQVVAPFEIGKAEELSMINFTNIYPTDVQSMTKNIDEGNYDLSSVNRQDEQGFPAIEYLLYGVGETDQVITDFYLQETAANYKTYLQKLTTRLKTMGNEVLDDWKSGYRETFIANDGSDATSSVNKIVNDYIFYYEKHLRAGKIGIPAGVFNGSPLADRVEGRYSGFSKELFMKGLNAMQNFFNGKPLNTNLSVEEIGLNDYLDYLNTIKDGEDLSKLINDQFSLIRDQAAGMAEDFGTQVESDNSQMLATYDFLQKNVIFLKVDMAQALSIRITYMDADGD